MEILIFTNKINHMELISLIVTIALVGLIVWGINVYIPMSPTIKKIINVLGDTTSIKVPHV
jgi:hypothetical protein